MELAAKVLEAQPKPQVITLSFDEVLRKMKEVSARKRPVMTQEEQMKDFRARVEQMNLQWELRAGK